VTWSRVRAFALEAAYNAGICTRILESHLQDVFSRGVEEGWDYLATIQLDVMFRQAWRSCHTRCDELMRYQPETPFLAQWQALNTFIRQVCDAFTVLPRGLEEHIPRTFLCQDPPRFRLRPNTAVPLLMWLVGQDHHTSGSGRPAGGPTLPRLTAKGG
jgi:hypothetical protein